MRALLSIVFACSMLVGYGQNLEDTPDKTPKFRIGMQGSFGYPHYRGHDGLFRNEWSASYSFGLLTSYKPMPGSRWSFNSGILGMGPFIDDNTEILCDMGYCPHDLRRDNYLTFPVTVEFAPIKSVKKQYLLSLGVGITPYLLLWGKRSEYRWNNNDRELYVWRRYSLFNSPKRSGMGLFAMNYVVSLKNEFRMGEHKFLIGLQSQFWLREKRAIQDNMSLYFGFLF